MATDRTEHQAGFSRVQRLTSSRKGRWLTAAVLVPVIGLSAYGGISSAGTTPTPTPTTTAAPSTAPTGFAGRAAAGGGSNARSGPAAGGSIGKVSSVTSSGFTLVTAAGEKVTVKETSSTKYEKGSKSASMKAVTTGKTALVLGTTSSTTITATQVIVQPTSSGTHTAYTPSKVVPFQQGTPSAGTKDGQIPANYTEGSGTIVSGSAANKATKAALAAYPGGVVDRVVKLSNGEYEVHNIGVNWPHHVFVSKDFKVVGAG
jgi:hypothetical protein